MPDRTPSPDTARGTAALGGLDIESATAERIARSVGGVTAAAGDFQDGLALDDAPNDIARLRAELRERAR